MEQSCNKKMISFAVQTDTMVLELSMELTELHYDNTTNKHVHVIRPK